MSEDLVFMMGKFEAKIPGDRRYSDNHLWLQADGNAWRVGLTAYSIRLLQDVYFLDWTVDAGASVRRKQEIGEIESSKALSSLYAPVDGILEDFNEGILDDPSAINTDGYGDGWLYRLSTQSLTLSSEQYFDLLNQGWERDQKMIKGQIQ